MKMTVSDAAVAVVTAEALIAAVLLVLVGCRGANGYSRRSPE